MPSPAHSTPVRRTQEDRRRRTRHKLLDATVECLSRLGYARTTTTEIVAAAGVSQGALFKYYPRKAALLAAAVEHLFAQLRTDYRRDLATLTGRTTGKRSTTTDLDASFDLLWEVYAGPRLIAAFELYMAARTDDELARHLQPVVQAHRAELLVHARELFPAAAAAHPDFDGFVALLMCAMEGILIEHFGTGRPDDAARRSLKTLAAGVLAAAESGAAS